MNPLAFNCAMVVAAFPEDAPSFKGVLDVAVSRLE